MKEAVEPQRMRLNVDCAKQQSRAISKTVSYTRLRQLEFQPPIYLIRTLFERLSYSATQTIKKIHAEPKPRPHGLTTAQSSPVKV